MERMVYLKDVVTLAFDREKCVGCGICSVVCPQAVMARDNGKARITDRDRCMECGACARNCPTRAITVTSGVGCAAAVINSVFGRGGSACCSADGQGSGC
jgi:NAD-dependent dihydropyrimidine dehydrogenase PreA subunit